MNQYLMNLLGEFHQVYNFGALGWKDEQIRFWDQRVKVTSRPNM